MNLASMAKTFMKVFLFENDLFPQAVALGCSELQHFLLSPGTLILKPIISVFSINTYNFFST